MGQKAPSMLGYKNLKLLFLLVLSCLFINSFSQDTLSVYFQTADYHLSKNEHGRLTKEFQKITTSLIDSVHFLGFAASIGNLNSNLKLSAKRASETKSLLKSLIGALVLF